jgi:hypothetical protein
MCFKIDPAYTIPSWQTGAYKIFAILSDGTLVSQYETKRDGYAYDIGKTRELRHNARVTDVQRPLTAAEGLYVHLSKTRALAAFGAAVTNNPSGAYVLAVVNVQGFICASIDGEADFPGRAATFRKLTPLYVASFCGNPELLSKAGLRAYRAYRQGKSRLGVVKTKAKKKATAKKKGA